MSTLYYLDGRTQADIARQLRLSRVKVSRLLRAAREAGIARIVVNPPRGSLVSLESELETRFELREVRIVPSLAGESSEHLRRRLAMAAAADLERSVRAGRTVALAGTDLIASMIELAWDPRIGASLRALDALDTLYTEVALPGPNIALPGEEFAPVGRIALRHFDRGGRMLGAVVDGRAVGCTVDQLHRARHVVALALGAAYARVIAAAMRTGLVGTLITDEITARAIAALPISREESLDE